MVDININVQETLKHYINRYVDYRRKGEYGTSSFWNWYYQVRNYIYQLDSANTPLGDGLSYTMPIWGEIDFSRNIINGQVYVLVTNLKINRTNFFNWIRYNRLPSRTPKPSPSQSITSWDFDDNYEPYNGIFVVVSNNGMYSLADENKKLLINKWFNSIEFPLVDNIENIETIGQGTASHFNYLITPNLEVLHPAEVAIRNRRKIENMQYINRIISETINDYISRNLLLYESNNKMLTDEEIMDKLSNLVSRLHAKGKLTQKEADNILFYGLYNNKHFQNRGRRSLN